MEQDELNDLLRDIAKSKSAPQPTTEERTRRFQSIVVEHLTGIRRALETLVSAYTGTTPREDATEKKDSGE